MANTEFSSLAEAADAFEALQSDFTASEQLAQESATEIANLKAERDTLKAEAEKASEALASLTAEANDAKEKVTALETEIAQLKAEAKTAEQRAAEIAGSSGIDPVDATPGSSNENAWEKYQAIKDPADKTAYWRANHSAIIAAAKAS